MRRALPSKDDPAAPDYHSQAQESVFRHKKVCHLCVEKIDEIIWPEELHYRPAQGVVGRAYQIKQLGEFKAPVRLHKGVTAVTVQVVNED
ncbi:MAG: hypothetical protein ABSG65_23740 [Bryobacteraceae bacterium]